MCSFGDLLPILVSKHSFSKGLPGSLLKDMSGGVGMIDYVRLEKPQTHAASPKRLAEVQSVLSGSSDLLPCHWSHCEQGKIS